MNRCGECCISPHDDNDLFLSSSAPPPPLSSPLHHNPLLSFPRAMMGAPYHQSQPVADHDASPANPYQVLQIRRDATAMEIRQSYKRLALWHHPGRQQAVEISKSERRRRFQFFNLLAACYETLISPDTRRRYDNLCREVEQSKLQAGVRGAMFVGGKPLIDSLSGTSSYDMAAVYSYSNKNITREAPPTPTAIGGSSRTTMTTSWKKDVVPPLSRSSSGSSTTDNSMDKILESSGGGNGMLLEETPSCCAPTSSSGSAGGGGGGSPSRSIKPATSRIVTGAATVTSNRSIPAGTTVGAAGGGGGTTSVALHHRPSLVDHSSASTSEDDDEEAESHYTESTTRRLFGGPLSHLFKARNFEPFSDPYDVFEKVFGSQPFQRISRKEIGGSSSSSSNLHSTSDARKEPTSWMGSSASSSPSAKPSIVTTATGCSPSTGSTSNTSPRSPTAAWKGDSQTSPDGKTTIFTTSRVLHDRILTRTETITRLSPHKTKTHVTVTAEPLTPASSSENGGNGEDTSPIHACMACFRPTSLSLSPDDLKQQQQGPAQQSPVRNVDEIRNEPNVEHDDDDDDDDDGTPVCANFCELYQNAVHELEFTANGLYMEWNNMVVSCTSMPTTGTSPTTTTTTTIPAYWNVSY